MRNNIKKWTPTIIAIVFIITSFIYLNNKIDNIQLIKEEQIVMTNNFSENVEKIIPSIVLILVEVDPSNVSLSSGDYVTINTKPNSKGTGFIVSEDGYILTANHVVNRAKNQIIVQTIRNNKVESYVAKMISADEKADTALLKIDANNLPFIKLGNSEEYKIGMDIGFIGFPLGINFPLTHQGIISAKIKNENEKKLIMLNAFVNPGNSGGPVFSAETGEVIGIISTKYNVVPEGIILPNYAMYPGTGVVMGGINFGDLAKTVSENRVLMVDLFKKGSSVGIGTAVSIEYGKGLLNFVHP